MRLRRWLSSIEPRVLRQFDRRWLAWMKPWIDSHELLSFRRHPLAVGVAIGVALGVIPTQIEVFLVFFLCVLFRGNIVAATVVGWYNNAFTVVPLYICAFYLGDFILPGTRVLPELKNPNGDWWGAFTMWVEALGLPLVVGLIPIGIGLGVISYFAVHLLWLRPVWARAKRMREALHIQGEEANDIARRS
jgi:uncharacterized protein